MSFTPPDRPIFTPPDTPVDSPSMVAGATRALLQGAMFGFSDEAEAGARALADRAAGEDFSEAYLRHRNAIREQIQRFREERPGLALGLELAGGFAVPGLGTAGAVARGANLAAKVKRGAAVGFGTGAAYGAGQAQELEDVPREMAGSGAIGLAVGGALPPVATAARSAFSAVRSAVRPEAGAARRIGQAIQRDEMTPEQLANALDEAQSLGRPATVADVGGEAVRRELEVAAMSPGAAGQLVERQLAKRNKEQLTRLSNDLIQGTGIKAGSIEQAITDTMKIRRQAAAPLYERAMNFQAELSDDIIEAYNATIKTPLGKQALAKAKNILNVEKFDEAPLMDRIDAVKRGMDDIIGAAQRQGESAVARSALKAKNGLVELVDAANPDYKSARQVWERESNYLDAIDRGREILKPGFTAAKVKQEFSSLTDAEQEAFRIGVVDTVVTRLRQQSAQEPNLIKLVRSPEIRDKLKAVMRDDAAARLDKILDIEDAMFRTASQTRKGSQTAQRVETMAEQKKMVGIVALTEEISSLLITPLRSLVVKGIPNLARGTRERLLAKQNAVIAKRLLSSDPDEVFSIPTPPMSPSGKIPGATIAPAVSLQDQPE